MCVSAVSARRAKERARPGLRARSRVAAAWSPFHNGASSPGCDGRFLARTQGVPVLVIRARLRTPPGAVQRGPAAQCFIVKGALGAVFGRTAGGVGVRGT